MKMKAFYAILVTALIVLTLLTFSFRGESNIVYGIADSREIEVNSELAVEIRKIHVVQGQSVFVGDTLVELGRADLTMEISDNSYQLQEIAAQKEARIQELKSNIRELESEYQMNRSLTSEIKSVKKDRLGNEKTGGNNPMAQKIANLKKELDYELSANNPLDAQKRRVRETMGILSAQQNRLVIKAPIDGVIGSVNFKQGEKVSPFAPVVTVHTKSPSLIRGYIHEKLYSSVAVGMKAYVYSLVDGHNMTTGDVVGVGSRIVEYPLRLRKRQDIQIWGREIIVQIPESNNFLLGEKVCIKFDANKKAKQ
jgi:multidrug resistance efflux pump